MKKPVTPPRQTTHTVIEILFKPLLIFFSVTGIVLQVRLDGGFFSTNVYLYFTILSNALTAIVFFVFFWLDIIERIAGKHIIPHWMLTLKYMMTSAMFLTLFVSAVLLMPFKDQTYLFSMKNLCQHIFAPLIALLDFLIFDRDFKIGKWTFALSFVFPLIYLTMTFLLSINPIRYSNGSNFPYYFLDYRTHGWWALPPNGLGVFWWLIIVAVMLSISTAVLLGIKKLISKFR